MKKLPKTLEEGESTYHNGDSGSMCGGVINQSTFDSEPMAYMMAYVMPDDIFEIYKKEKDEKKRHAMFNKFARSMI
jgi:hypothetical protein